MVKSNLKTKSCRVKLTPEMVDAACQCSLRVPSADSCFQAGSGATLHVTRAVNTARQTHQDAAVMTMRVESVSRMTETDVRLVDVPEIDYFTSKLTLNSPMDQVNSC